LTAGNGETIQRSSHRAAILEVSDLASLPPGRMIVMAAGAKPTLAATIHWSELDRDTVELIRHSDALHNPKGADADPHAEQPA
jgi:type IV secretory pathway TraG/TraD family ATPase VirD4